ncbi:FAD/NAD-binding domain-containing protein [Phellopilus nigrolimitatus]|nr:FAD/NAD-binding domain-containing protein [Phellopilus nigrolimitatus]
MHETTATSYDCIVVGSGHAGSCAALSAFQSGCKRVLIVEKAPKEWAGGNGFFTAGAHRTAHGGLNDLLPLVHNVSPQLASTIDLDPYSPEEFAHDIMRLSHNQSDVALVKELVDNSRSAIDWLAHQVGVHFILSFRRQAYQVDGRQKFWGGLVLSVEEGGKGLIADHHRALEMAQIEIWFGSPATEILAEDDSVTGLVIRRDDQEIRLSSPTVILACGGFEASPDLRAKHLGDEWAHARVRGTPYNTGDGIALATIVGARRAGDWSSAGCHSTCWDAHASPSAGDRILSNQLTKSGYPLGLMLNSSGLRFVDEGEDFRNYTYARFGRAILAQPGGVAFQVYDAQVTGWLREEEYGDGIVQKVHAESIEELAEKLVDDGLAEPSTFVQTIKEYNTAVEANRAAYSNIKWDPAVKDGLSTESPSSPKCLIPPKSNWALPLTSPPFLAVKVACGITFTFGGLAIDPYTAGVLSENSGLPIPGLFCTGELVGGLFFGNYPGGSGLTAGAVFGRKAGKAAAEVAKNANAAASQI